MISPRDHITLRRIPDPIDRSAYYHLALMYMDRSSPEALPFALHLHGINQKHKLSSRGMYRVVAWMHQAIGELTFKPQTQTIDQFLASTPYSFAERKKLVIYDAMQLIWQESRHASNKSK